MPKCLVVRSSRKPLAPICSLFTVFDRPLRKGLVHLLGVVDRCPLLISAELEEWVTT